MLEQNPHLETLKDIRQMMERSSRFISLSGLSGVAAGSCALASAWYTYTAFGCRRIGDCDLETLVRYPVRNLTGQLILIGLVTFMAAFALAFLFTWLRSRKTGVPIWGHTARKVLLNVAIPMLVGAVMVLRFMDLGLFGLVAPACLIFYGLGLVNASKFTFPEIRLLGFGQIILGLINLWLIGYGLYFWALGFGLLHILHGIVMWWKYERK